MASGMDHKVPLAYGLSTDAASKTSAGSPIIGPALGRSAIVDAQQLARATAADARRSVAARCGSKGVPGGTPTPVRTVIDTKGM